MSQPVMADAQFGMAKLLRPYETFQTVYQGQNAMHPIMFTELKIPSAQGGWGEPLDDLAGTNGYSDNLVKGLRTPVGARVILMLPRLYYPLVVNGANTLKSYTWLVMWRLRTAYCFRQTRMPFHLPFQATAPFSGGAQNVPLVAAGHSVAYAQTELNKVWQPTNIHVYEGFQAGGRELYTGAATENPEVLGIIMPDGSTGSVNNATISGAPVNYSTHEIQACGDEMLIGIVRTDLTPPGVAAPTWNFNPGGTDVLLVTNGVNRLRTGPYVMIGSAP